MLYKFGNFPAGFKFNAQISAQNPPGKTTGFGCQGAD